MVQICAKKGNPRNKKCGATFYVKLLDFLESPKALGNPGFRGQNTVHTHIGYSIHL
jgi:hypothetical protein